MRSTPGTSTTSPTLATTSTTSNINDAREGGKSSTAINVNTEELQRNGLNDGGEEVEVTNEGMRELERRLVRKVDLRLCTIAGILCSLNLCEFCYCFTVLGDEGGARGR